MAQFDLLEKILTAMDQDNNPIKYYATGHKEVFNE